MRRTHLPSVLVLALAGTSALAQAAPPASPAMPPPAPLQVQPAAPQAVPPAPQMPPRHDPADDVRRISPADAKKALDAGTAVIIDVRAPQDFAAQHVTGALNHPVYDIVAHAKELAKDKLIITYCT